MDPYFTTDNLTHRKPISIVSMGLQALCEFFAFKKFQKRFWMITGSDLFGDAVMLPHIISFLWKKPSSWGIIISV